MFGSRSWQEMAVVMSSASGKRMDKRSELPGEGWCLWSTRIRKMYQFYLGPGWSVILALITGIACTRIYLLMTEYCVSAQLPH